MGATAWLAVLRLVPVAVDALDAPDAETCGSLCALFDVDCVGALRFFDELEVVVPELVALVEPFVCESFAAVPVACELLLAFPSSGIALLREVEPDDFVLSTAPFVAAPACREDFLGSSSFLSPYASYISISISLSSA